ncbi:TrkH family potassium uptake protein [Candidatus Poribacteria bacterium]|nr:TrkH family potassium uptake protein [Candidatus Poribacteria bacterium]
MILKPTAQDFRIILFNTGRVIIGLAYILAIPFFTSLALCEWGTAIDFAIAISASLIVGYLLLIIFHTDRDPQWVHGMSASAISWLACTLLGAIPHMLSGHFGSYLDACFDVMSGYTTTGLVLIQDLDHIAIGLNIWRHILTYVGGQGMVVVALTFLVPGFSGAYKMYVGEGKDERLLPNVIKTAQMIWLISLVYLFIGTTFFWIAGIIEGLAPLKALYHGLCMFMSNWSTGGFAPQSQNLLYYHSPLIEFISIFIMIAGSMNFALHYAIWIGNYREIYRNIEMKSFTITMTIAFVLTCSALIASHVFPDIASTFRMAFLHIASAHTTTGVMSVYARQYIVQWGSPAMVGMILAMAIGGSACSTAGGFKGMRVGILAKAISQDIKKFVSPESSIVIQRFHHIKDIVLEDSHVRSAALVVILYVLIYSIGTAVGMIYGYPALDSLFDAVSAGSNSGLSCGVTSATMPALLKAVYFFSMWAGRLEFNAILVLLGVGYASITGK